MDYSDQMLVESTVMDFINKKYSFTAYDVTKSVRKQSQNRVYHGEVNTEVQRLYSQDEMGDYVRDLVDVGAPVEPWVYHDPSVLSSSYDKDWMNTGTQTITTVSSTPSTSNLNVDPVDDEEEEQDEPVVGTAKNLPDSVKDAVQKATNTPSGLTSHYVSEKVTVKPTKEGRITVSAKLIGKLSTRMDLQGVTLEVRDVRDGYLAIGFPSGGSVSVVGSDSTPKHYIVDEDNRIRISKRLLAQANLDDADELDCSLVITGGNYQNYITVTKAPVAVAN